MFLYYLLTAIPAYIIGGINGAIITSKYIYKKDIRKYGSGNPGLTNFYRVFGAKGVLLVILIDIVKTAVPVIFGKLLFGYVDGNRLLGAELSALFVMLGHAYPVFYHFKGGKTVLSAGTALFFIDARVAAVSWIVFILVLVITKYVSLGSIIGGGLYPVSVAVFGLGGTAELIIAILSAVFLISRHSENIKRLISHTESKFSLKKGEAK